MTSPEDQETDVRLAVDRWTDTHDYCTLDQFFAAHPQIPDTHDSRSEAARAFKYFGYVRGFIRHAKLGE